MVKISLHSQKHPGLVTFIDDDDFELVCQYRWGPYWSKRAKTFYVRGKIPGKGFCNRPFITMHRLIMDVPMELQTDHIDHNGLNNQKYNLRIATGSQNMANSRKPIHGTSKYKGVYYKKALGKWCAKISKDGKYYHLGHRDSEIECAHLYDVKAIELYGEFALTNKMLGLL